MSGSSAGLNRVFANILTVYSGASAVASPLAGYGTIGLNDSGMALNEAMNFTKWSASLLGGGTGMTVTLYGTTDPRADAAWRQAMNPGLYPSPVTVPASSWFVLPGPSEQSGTGSIANPMVNTANSTAFFQYSGALMAIRAVLTASASASGLVTVSIQAVP